MKQTSFSAMATRYAQVMGRRGDVSLSFGGTEAATDGRHIKIPAMPPGTVLTKQQERVYGGYIDHEAGHVRGTDFKVWREFAERNMKDRGVAAVSLANVIEDVRQENEYIEYYPGARAYLDALCFHVDRETKAEREQKKEKRTAAEDLFSLIYKEAYAVYRNVDTNVIDGNLKDVPEAAEIYRLMCEGMPRLQNTRDAWILAEQVYDAIPKGLSWGDFSTGDLERLFTQLMQGDGKKALDAAAVLVIASRGDHDRIIQSLQDKVTTLNGEIETQTKASKGKSSRRVKGSLRMRGQRPLPPDARDEICKVPMAPRDDYQHELTLIHDTLLAMKKMLRLRLVSRDKRAFERDLEDGELDPLMLPEMLQGNRRVRRQRRDIQRVNTAVLLSVDLSSSMHDQTVRSAALLMAEALDTVRGVKTHIEGWDGIGGFDYDAPSRPGVGRMSGMRRSIVKTFDEDWRRVKYRIGNVRTGGLTPLGAAAAAGFEELVTRTEPRRILWIITDGQPMITAGDSEHCEYATLDSVKRKANALGMEVVGMYVGRQAKGFLKPYVNTYIEVRKMAELPAALLGGLGRTLR